MGKNQHVVPHQGQWGVRGEGNGRLTSLHDTQAEAIDSARTIAQNQGSELFIHNRQGQIRDRDSHGNDPFPPRG
jgi:cytochrome b